MKIASSVNAQSSGVGESVIYSPYISGPHL